jgi:hypothetical protein
VGAKLPLRFEPESSGTGSFLTDFSAFSSRIAPSRSSSTSVALGPTDFNERETTHFGWPPRRREGVLLCIPLRMIVVPIMHDLIHLATVHTACLPLGKGMVSGVKKLQSFSPAKIISLN